MSDSDGFATVGDLATDGHVQMSELAPVSAALEAALREEARQHGIVVWLDRHGVYTAFADRLRARAEAGEFPHPVRCLRGSYLDLMHQLDGIEDGIGPTPLVLHVPGHTADSISTTPLYELYCAGHSYLRALETLVRETAHGHATPEAISGFLAGGQVTLEGADRWLAELKSTGVGSDLPDLGLLGGEDLYDKLVDGKLDEHVTRAIAMVWSKAEAVLGIDQAWRERVVIEPGPHGLADALAAWALSVEFVHDLRRAPVEEALLPLKTLPKLAIDACRRLAGHLRDRHIDSYKRIADETERALGEEVARSTASDLGKVDTFRFEDQKVMAAALEALGGARYTEARDFAVARTAGTSFWTRNDHGRRVAWSLIELASTLGCEVIANDELLAGMQSLSDAVSWYADHGWRVDRAHRQLEQARQQLLHIELDELAHVRVRLDEMRGVYRRWADALSVAWNALAARAGVLPPSELQQRTLFDDVVAPLVGDEVTAYVMVDALRFEMGRELARAIEETRAAEVVVSARLAELPTVTEVGMNVLAPVVRNGKLTVDLDEDGVHGFRAGGVRVDDPEKRRKVIHERIGGETCPKLTLEELLDRDVTGVRKVIARARLVVVHADGIDRAGEKGMGLAVFDQELQNLRAAWRLLQEAGVRRLVFTADHGFLLHDLASRAPKPHGKLTDPDARYAIATHFIEETGEVTVASRDLGYDGNAVWFQFPATTAPFDRGKKVKDFAHGGPSPQERVIPVVVVRHHRALGGETARYQIELGESGALAGMHWLRGSVKSAGQASLAYGGRSELELALECVDDPEVRVELVDVRSARLGGGAVFATVDAPFEAYFRLIGPVDRRVPVRVRHATRSANVVPADSTTRFQVEVRTAAVAVAVADPPGDERWLSAFSEGGVRSVLQHLATFGSIDEAEMVRMLGSARAYRTFCRKFDEDYRAKLPFTVRIDTASGKKLYVRGDR